MRTSKYEWFLDMAERCAKQGTCLRRNFGAIIVDQNNIVISTGYTGAPSGQVDCLERGTCWRKNNNIQSGSYYEKCYSVHAEMNAIMQAGKEARGSTLFLCGIDKDGNSVGIIPCLLCAKMIINAGIKEVVVRTGYASYRIMDPNDIYEERVEEAFQWI